MIKSDKKTNVRSFRYSDDVKEILEKFEGTNLNEKFENLIRYCYNEVPAKKKQIDNLDKEIKKKNNDLINVSKKARDIESLINQLNSLKYSIELVGEKAKKIIETS